MHCYYHPDKDAVGSCKSCGKGLCVDCAVDLKKGLACRDHCEEDVRALIQLIEQNIKMQPTAARLMQGTGGVRLGATLFFVVMGLVFLIYGLNDERDFPVVMGVCFLAYGAFTYWWSRKLAVRRGQATQNDNA